MGNLLGGSKKRDWSYSTKTKILEYVTYLSWSQNTQLNLVKCIPRSTNPCCLQNTKWSQVLSSLFHRRGNWGSEQLRQCCKMAWYEAEAGFKEKFSHLHLTTLSYYALYHIPIIVIFFAILLGYFWYLCSLHWWRLIFQELIILF